jgi:hypothetical protein
VEPHHLDWSRPARPENLHMFVKTVRKNKAVRHTDSNRLHRMALVVVEIADLLVVEVRNARL